MRSEDEIKRAIEILDAGAGNMDDRGDNFRFGYLMGKTIALEWVCGDAPSSDIARDFDFEDWKRELKEAADEVRRRLNLDEDNDATA